MLMRLYLVRHGQTAWNVEGRAQGHTDIPLDDVGKRQKALLGMAFRGADLRRIYSSDLVRARETAEALAAATGAAMELRRDLRERSFGEWEGQSFRDVADWTIEESIRQGLPRVAVRPPGGESYRDLWDRTGDFIRTVVDAGEDVAVVSHGGTCSVLMAQLAKGTPDSARSFRFGNTAVYEVHRRDDGYFVIVRYNDTSHLDTATPPSATESPLGAAPAR